MAHGPLRGPSTLQVPLSAQFCCSTVGGNFVFLTLAIRSYTPGQASTKLTWPSCIFWLYCRCEVDDLIAPPMLEPSYSPLQCWEQSFFLLAGVFSTREQTHVQRTSQHWRAEPCRYGKVKKRFVKLILTRVVCKNVVFHIASQERNQDLKLPCKVHGDLLSFFECRRRVDVGVLKEEKVFSTSKNLCLRVYGIQKI